MPYDRDRHHRRSIRLNGYDYASPGAYFVTICTRHRQTFFDRPEIRQTAEACWLGIPEHVSGVALDEWVVMPNHIHGIIVIVEHAASKDAAATNTDHPGTGVQLNAQTENDNGMTSLNSATPPSEGRTENILASPDHPGRGVQLNAPTAKIDGMTSLTLPPSRTAGTPYSAMSPRRNTLSVMVRTYKAAVTTSCRNADHADFSWQRNYYEHVVRNRAELDAIRRYILDNPAQWAFDRDNPINTRHLPPPTGVAGYLQDLAQYR